MKPIRLTDTVFATECGAISDAGWIELCGGFSVQMQMAGMMKCVHERRGRARTLLNLLWCACIQMFHSATLTIGIWSAWLSCSERMFNGKQLCVLRAAPSSVLMRALHPTRYWAVALCVPEGDGNLKQN